MTISTSTHNTIHQKATSSDMENSLDENSHTLTKPDEEKHAPATQASFQQYPQFVLDDSACTQLNITTRHSTNRTPLESGMIEQSPVTRHPWLEYRLTYQLSTQVYLRFWQWWYHSLIQGSLPFVWKNPHTKKSQPVQIMEGKFTAQPVDSSMNTWVIQLVLESCHHGSF